MNSDPPIILKSYDPGWPAKFEAERRLLSTVLKPWLAGPIEHVGSTAVADLEAKPTIDIMAAVHDLPSSMPAIEALQSLNYCYAAYRENLMHWFCKPSVSKRTYHLHLVPFKSVLWDERIIFRDALRESEALRSEYLLLKTALASKYREDREAYTEGKTEFVRSVLRGTGM